MGFAKKISKAKLVLKAGTYSAQELLERSLRREDITALVVEQVRPEPVWRPKISILGEPKNILSCSLPHCEHLNQEVKSTHILNLIHHICWNNNPDKCNSFSQHQRRTPSRLSGGNWYT